MKLLLISPWAASDVLTQSYVLPYIPLIKQALLLKHRHVVIHLVTLEKFKLRRCQFFSDDLPCDIHYPLFFPAPSLLGYILLFFELCKGCFRSQRNKYDFIQSWCATGGAIGYVFSILSRTPLLLDSFEPHADAMAETGCWSPYGFKYTLLKFFETQQAKRASAFFPVCRHMFEYSQTNYKVNIQGRAAVKPACVELPDIVKSSSVSYSQRVIRGLYVGKFGGLYLGVDFFRILRVAQLFWGSCFSFTILSCQKRSSVIAFAEQADFDLSSVHFECVPHSRVPDYLSSADFAISSLKPVPSRLCCTPVKNGEYWAYGLPVLTTPGISIDSDLIQENKIGVVLESLSDLHIHDALRSLDCILASNVDGCISDRIRGIASQYRGFNLARSAYASVYSRLSLSHV